jgi:hypothetical protein
MDLQEIGCSEWVCGLDKSGSGRERWLAVVNVAMNFQVPKILRVSWLAEQLIHSQEGLYSVDDEKAVEVTNFNTLQPQLSLSMCIIHYFVAKVPQHFVKLVFLLPRLLQIIFYPVPTFTCCTE